MYKKTEQEFNKILYDFEKDTKIYTVSLVRSFEKIVLFSNPTTKIKTKSWLYFAGICLLLLITFLPVYNILRTIMNPELIKRLIN